MLVLNPMHLVYAHNMHILNAYPISLLWIALGRVGNQDFIIYSSRLVYGIYFSYGIVFGRNIPYIGYFIN